MIFDINSIHDFEDIDENFLDKFLNNHLRSNLSCLGFNNSSPITSLTSIDFLGKGDFNKIGNIQTNSTPFRKISKGQGLDTNEKKVIAQWMAKEAINAGLPPELPVMASLVESSLNNLTYGDRDSVGFFQIRVSIHGIKAVETPEAQIKWFISTAKRAPVGNPGKKNGWTMEVFLQNIKEAQRINNSSQIALWLGRWCQDIERSAFPDRYKQKYEEAINLIYK